MTNETSVSGSEQEEGGRWGRTPYLPEDLKEEYPITDSGRLRVTCPGCFKEWYPTSKCCVDRYAGSPFCPDCGTDFRLSMVELDPPEWPLAPGAVLYEDRPDTPDDERRLHHVTARRIDPDTDEKFLVIEDGTHTTKMHYRVEDALADFTPAGWQWPIGSKPTYHLTRNCGVDDRTDLMTDGGQPSTGSDRRSVCKHCGSGVSRANVRENTYECPTHGVISGASVLYVEDDGLRADGGQPSTGMDRFEVEVAVAAIDVLPWPSETPVAAHVSAEGIDP